MSIHSSDIKLVDEWGGELTIRVPVDEVLPGKFTGIVIEGKSHKRLVFEVDRAWIAKARREMKERGEI